MQYNAQSRINARIRARRINTLTAYILWIIALTGFLAVSEMDYQDQVYRSEGIIIIYSQP